MRARPPAAVYNDELTMNVQEIVLDNPNHVKEFLYRNKWSAWHGTDLAHTLQINQKFDADIIHSLCDRGSIKTDALD